MSSDARARARARWEEATRHSLDTAEAVLEALEALGSMLLAGESLEPSPYDVFVMLTAKGEMISHLREPLTREVTPALDHFAADAATFALVDLLDELEGSEAPESLRRRSLDLLRWRDRAELVRLALEALETPIEDFDEALTAFDDLLDDRLWLLVAFNDDRQLAPDDPHRAHWWWQRGAHLSPSSALELFAVAELVETFPAAAAAFDRTRALVRNAARTVAKKSATDPADSVEKTATVVSLREWAARRSGATGLRLAAATETPLWRSDDVELSFVAPDLLVVDLIADRRRDALPHLELGAERVVATAVEGAIERFTLRLSEDARGTLVLPLVRGDLRISLPLDDDA